MLGRCQSFRQRAWHAKWHPVGAGMRAWNVHLLAGPRRETKEVNAQIKYICTCVYPSSSSVVRRRPSSSVVHMGSRGILKCVWSIFWITRNLFFGLNARGLLFTFEASNSKPTISETTPITSQTHRDHKLRWAQTSFCFLPGEEKRRAHG